MAETEKVYRPFPKCLDSDGQEVLDKKLVKEQYMRSPHLSWAAFCDEYGYHSNYRAYFPIRSWKEEKLAIKVELGDEGLLDLQLEARNKVLLERANYPIATYEEAQRSEAFLAYTQRQMLLDLQWDEKNRELITADPSKKRFKELSYADQKAILTIKHMIADLKAKALLLDKQGAFASAIPIQNADPQITQAESEGERLREMGVAVLGQSALTEERMTQMLNKWIDQAARPDPVAEEVEPNTDQPLDNLDE